MLTMEILRSGFNFLQGITLKKRIVLIFAVGTLIPFVSAVLISYNTISSILTSKLDDDVRNNLKQVRQSLESTIKNLNHVSQQLSISGSVGMKLNTYLTTEQQYDRAQLRQEINSELNVITFTNPNIGLTTYYLDQENTH
jgi:two-component system, sensor histidine kinase YesM